MVWVGRDLKDHLVPTPCHGQRHLPLDQGAQSPIQPGLEHCQGWGTHSCSGQPVQRLTSLTVKSFFLISNLNLPSFSLDGDCLFLDCLLVSLKLVGCWI